MDLDISMRSSACLYTVHFYGALFREGDVWICMEVMDMSLDKFYPRVFKNNRVISEDILGKVSMSTGFHVNSFMFCCYMRLVNLLIITICTLIEIQLISARSIYRCLMK